MNSKLTITLTAILTVLTLFATAEPRQETTLYPGESHTFFGVELKWDVPDSALTTEESAGAIIINGPKTKDLKFTVGDFMKNSSKIKIDGPRMNIRFHVYVDEVTFYIIIFGEKKSDIETVFSKCYVESWKYTSSYNVGPGAINNIDLWVSQFTPGKINDWEFSISKDRKKFADDVEFQMLEVKQSSSDEVSEVPLEAGLERQVGRFNIRIERYDDDTQTTHLRIDVSPDLLLKGKDAWVEQLSSIELRLAPQETITLERIFDYLSNRYEFEVKWESLDDYPDSAEQIRSLICDSYFCQRLAMSDLIKNLSNWRYSPPGYNLRIRGVVRGEWETPTLLKIYPTDSYVDMLKGKEQIDNKDKINKETQESFEKDYKLQTKVYTFDSIGPSTAKSLIEDDLKEWFLIQYRSNNNMYIVDHVPETANKLETSKELAVADEKSGTLILTAIPKNIEKFENLIAKIDAAVGGTEKSAFVKPIPIVVTLLMGSSEAGPGGMVGTVDRPEVTFDPKLAEKYGFSKEDMETFGIKSLGKVATGFVTLIPEKGKNTSARTALTPAYSVELEFEDIRDPYLIVRGKLIKNSKSEQMMKLEAAGRGSEAGMMGGFDQQLFANTLYIEPGVPQLLGITNMKETLILVVEWRGSGGEAEK